MAKLPSALDFFRQMQSDFRKKEYRNSTEAQAQNVVSEYYCKQAIEALEKQIPKVPTYEGDGYADGQLVYDTWICSNCGKYYEVDYDNYNYCPNCGQRLDLSEV